MNRSNLKMSLQPDTPTGAAIASAPSVAYLVARYVIDLPIEKWVSFLGLVFLALQITFLIKDRMRKHRERKRFQK